MSKKPLPLPRVTARVIEGDNRSIASEFHRYVASLHDAAVDSANRLSVPADSGAWPLAGQIAVGAMVLWKNGAALRLYVNDGGTLRYVNFI